MELHANSKAVRPLAPGVIAVSKKGEGFDPYVILQNGKDRERFEYYRDGVYVKGLPSMLPADSIKAINEECDKHEGCKNKAVKSTLRDALKHYFKGVAFHMNEAGPGQFPLINSFAANADVSYHGIELDEHHIDTLKTKMNLSASDWKGIPDLPKDRPSIGVSVYALQFMVKRDLPQKLKSLISDDGFYVGNMYLNPLEKEKHTQSAFLEKVLRENKMGFVRLKDPQCSANEYWVISKTTDTGNIENFGAILSNLLKSRTPQNASKPQEHHIH